MAWMFQQQGRLLVAIRLMTHVTVSMHTRALKCHECAYGWSVHFCVCCIVYVWVHEYDLVCIFQPVYAHVEFMCPLMHGYMFVRLPVCYVHINALSCCPVHYLLHNEGQTVEKG